MLPPSLDQVGTHSKEMEAVKSTRIADATCAMLWSTCPALLELVRSIETALLTVWMLLTITRVL